MIKVNVKKFVKSIFLILSIIGGISLFLMNSSLSYQELEYTTKKVYAGDTLWSIAQELQQENQYYKGKDLRDIIAHLTKINNLESKTVYANQELTVPMI